MGHPILVLYPLLPLNLSLSTKGLVLQWLSLRREPREPSSVGRHGACRDGRRCVRPADLRTQAHLQVSWLVLYHLLLLGGGRWP